MADAGADAVEVGIPFSDPAMDGPTIEEASVRALARGTTPAGILGELAEVDAGVPLVAMTYYNLVFRAGELRFARSLAEAGVAGAIVPDLPLEESASWEREAAAAGVDATLLAAPVTPDDRLRQVAERSRGFVYAVSVMGITGARDRLAASAAVLARRLKDVTDRPVVIGFGISTPEQAVEACREADGVVVASALIRRLLDGGGPDEAAAFVHSLREALDRG
ncbi:MAG: tryptophan synthase [Acidimicrobiales bacterium]|nr:tryptophan synthase [Acidimicrobiales bacterium]